MSLNNVANLFHVLKSSTQTLDRPQLESKDDFPKESVGRLVKAEVVKAQGDQALVKLDSGELIRLKTDLKLDQGMRLKLLIQQDKLAELVSVNVKQNDGLKEQLGRFTQAVSIQQNLKPKDLIGQQIKITPQPTNTTQLKAGTTLTGQVTTAVEPKTQTQNLQIQKNDFALQVPPVQDKGSQIQVKVISPTEVEVLDVKNPKELEQLKQASNNPQAQQAASAPRKVRLLTETMDKIPPFKKVVADLVPKASVTVSSKNDITNELVQKQPQIQAQQQQIHIQHVKLPSGRLVTLEVQGKALPEGTQIVLEANSNGRLNIKDLKLPVQQNSQQPTTVQASVQKTVEGQPLAPTTAETKPVPQTTNQAPVDTSKPIQTAEVIKQVTPTMTETKSAPADVKTTVEKALSPLQTEVKQQSEISPKEARIEQQKVDILEARVIGKVRQGVYELKLSTGEQVQIASDKALYKNMQLTVRTVVGGNLELMSVNQPGLNTTQNALLKLTHKLEGLDKIMQEVDKDTAQDIKKQLPSLDRDFAPKIINFAQAVASAKAEEFFGRDVMNMLRALGLEPNISQDFSNMQQASKVEADGWRSFIFPYVEDQHSNPKQGGFYWKNHTNEDDESGNKTEFLMDLHLSNLGTVQVDGYMNNKEIQINLHMTETLSETEKKDITEILHKATQSFDVYGKISFIQQPEIENRALDKLINYRNSWNIEV